MTHRVFPSWCYGDPARAYEQKEASTCRGCIHVAELLGKLFCEKGKKQYPKKCRVYQGVTCSNQ